MFEEIGDGVFRRRFDSLDLNVGVVVGTDGVLIVDTRASTGQATQLLEELRGLTHQPVRWVVNSHWHWDHVLGNSVFAGAEIFGHEICRSVLLERADETRQAAIAWMPEGEHDDISSIEVIPPTRVFADSVSIDVGRTIELDYHGRGHTNADITVRVPDASVVFMGDLIEEGAPPAYGDSYPLEWPATLEQASAQSGLVIVPGHGDVVEPRFVTAQLSELFAVADVAARWLAGEIGLEEAITTGPYPHEVMEMAMTRARMAS